MSDPRVRLATPDDAEAYAHCYVESLAETYAHIMPPAFAQTRRDTIADEVAATRAELEQMTAALGRGELPRRTHWVGVVDDEVVGIVSAGPDISEWEQRFYTNPEPPIDWNLDHLYTRRSTHGSGLGQALFDVALASAEFPDGRGCWLWVLRNNPRAEAFYRRNGLVPDGLEVNCGDSWFGAPMFRMWRPDPA